MGGRNSASLNERVKSAPGDGTFIAPELVGFHLKMHLEEGCGHDGLGMSKRKDISCDQVM